MKILIVDDEYVIRHGCRMILEEQGYTVETTATCGEAIDAVSSNPYDLVLLDLKLPDRDGTELFKAVPRGVNGYPRIIVMSGYFKLRDGMSADDRARFDFLPKPFTDQELLAAVEQNTIG